MRGKRIPGPYRPPLPVASWTGRPGSGMHKLASLEQCACLIDPVRPTSLKAWYAARAGEGKLGGGGLIPVHAVSAQLLRGRSATYAGTYELASLRQCMCLFAYVASHCVNGLNYGMHRHEWYKRKCCPAHAVHQPVASWAGRPGSGMHKLTSIEQCVCLIEPVRPTSLKAWYAARAGEGKLWGGGLIPVHAVSAQLLRGRSKTGCAVECEVGGRLYNGYVIKCGSSDWDRGA
jgi:hypothetical protein